MIEIGRVTVFDCDLRDMLAAIDRLRAEHPDRAAEPVSFSAFSENYITGLTSNISITHDAMRRTFEIVERKQ